MRRRDDKKKRKEGRLCGRRRYDEGKENEDDAGTRDVKSYNFRKGRRGGKRAMMEKAKRRGRRRHGKIRSKEKGRG